MRPSAANEFRGFLCRRGSRAREPSRPYYRAYSSLPPPYPISLRAAPVQFIPAVPAAFFFPPFSICSPSFAKCRVDRRISAPLRLYTPRRLRYKSSKKPGTPPPRAASGLPGPLFPSLVYSGSSVPLLLSSFLYLALGYLLFRRSEYIYYE
jgi:hypothetical protein